MSEAGKPAKPTDTSAPITRAELLAELAANPRFQEVKTLGDGVIIVGARPPK